MIDNMRSIKEPQFRFYILASEQGSAVPNRGNMEGGERCYIPTSDMENEQKEGIIKYARTSLCDYPYKVGIPAVHLAGCE